MARIVESGLLRDVFESAVAQIFEQDVTCFYRRHKQVRAAIIVNVSKGSSHTYPITQAYSCLLGDILEAAISQVSPKFAAAELVDEVNVVEAVSVYVRRGHTIAMVIVDWVIQLRSIIHN